MEQYLRFLLFIFFSGSLIAQTGIGTTTPNASAKLDVYATNKGFLPPRVTLTSATDNTTIPSPAEGLLVYNNGNNSGLVAGYYYWNGANWATIATSTGSGVMSADLTKIYDGVANAATINGTGATFTVPTSGTYLFDFSCGATNGNGTVTLNFYVRDGSTVLKSDMQTSYNNNVHAEYNGKIEVNLVAGKTYNVLVSATSGGVYSNDYCRVYMKQMSGNIPINGQSVEYGIARFSGADGGSLAAGTLVSFDAAAAGNLAWSGNKFTLKANKTYELESSLAVYLSSGGVGGRFQIYDYTNSVSLANGLFMSQNGAGTNNPSANSPMKGIVTPATDIQVGIRLLDYYGPAGPGIIGSTSFTGTQSSPNASYFMVQQIGSSAIINPWTLAGSNTYNMTGNVGIGTNAPTEKLEVSGNVKATNFLGTATAALSAPTNITYGEIDVPQNLAVGSGFVDLANIPLPSAGKYKITFAVRGSVTTNATLSVLLLRNGSNAQVSGTEAMPIYNAAGVQNTCTQVSVITTTAAETYKLSVWTQAGTGSFNVINDGNGRSKVLWEKIQ
jgi:hypothetical protein